MVFTAICLVAGGFFLAIGAWPVFGFFGLDIPFLYLAFRINYRRARRYEMLEMRDGRLVLSKVTATGKVRDWVFDPYWVRVRLEKVITFLDFTRMAGFRHPEPRASPELSKTHTDVGRLTPSTGQ